MGKIFENLLFKKPLTLKKVQIYLQGDLMQNQVVKVMTSGRLGPQLRKVIVHVFISEILANMPKVSNLAPGPVYY
jgi:hypothetical protein